MKKMWKKLTSFALALVVLLSLTTFAFAAEVNGEYYYANKYFWNDEEGNLQTKQNSSGMDNMDWEAFFQSDYGQSILALYPGMTIEEILSLLLKDSTKDSRVTEDMDWESYVNSELGEWHATQEIYKAMGDKDPMAEAVVQHWAGIGMKKELFHHQEEGYAEYSLFTPMYRPDGMEFPLMVVCHMGGGSCYDAEWYGFVEEAAARGYMVMCISWMTNPYTDLAAAAGMSSEAYAFKTALEEVIANGYPVDETRVYVAGLSGGGNAAAYIASDCPELVTAVMPCTGAKVQGQAVASGGIENPDVTGKIAEIGLGLMMGYGKYDPEFRWPISDKLQEMGSSVPRTLQERVDFVNEWISACGAVTAPTTLKQVET